MGLRWVWHNNPFPGLAIVQSISHAQSDPAGRIMKRWLLKLAFHVGMPLALWPVKLLDSPRSMPRH